MMKLDTRCALGLTTLTLLASMPLGCAKSSQPAPTRAVVTDTSNPLVDSGTRASVAQTSDAQSDETGPAAPTARQSPPPTLAPGAPKIIAIGDVHGDVGATRKVLKLAGAIDDQDNWVGGKLVVVQVGDQLDRGNDEKAILLLLDVVADRAHKAGGALYVLNGNHETMNVALNFSYVTPGGWKDFADVPHVPDDKLLASFSPEKRGRVSAFRPAGPYATLLSGHNTIQVVGDNVFVHGGLLPKHVTYGIGKINKEISAWMKSGGTSPASISSEDSPVWSRHYSSGTDAADCKLAAEMLSMLNAKRIVVAHTVQSKGINAACGGKVWRVDVGLSKHYGGKPQVLVIEGDNVSIQK